MASVVTALVPGAVALCPMPGQPKSLLPLPVFCIVVPMNFLMLRFFLTRGDK